jgi:23S rRNA pseudouridine1911/1915/1917 synthase
MMNRNQYGTNRKKDERTKETHLVVTEPMELMKFLLAKLSGKGRNQVKGLLSRGQVSVDGKAITQYNHPLETGKRVVINWSQIVKEEKISGLNILYEDTDLIVIDKQAGLLSIASDKEKIDTAYHILTDHVRRSNPKNRIFVVHRLDRDTSGVMMYAKNEKVKHVLQDSWQDSVLDRRYIALVEGSVHKAEGTITSWLKESKTLTMLSSPTPNGGQKAVTHFKVLQKSSAYSLLEVRLETGRKNQIRVHMQDIGHSIVGDKKYGSTQNPIGRLGLHALVISFHHPTTGELMHFETKIPGKFLQVFKSKEN